MLKNQRMANYEILEELFRHYEQPMYRICFGILGNSHQAEDAVADAFERLIPYLSQCAGVTDDRTKKLIIRITKSAALDIYRKNKKESNVISIDEHAYLETQSNGIEDYLDLQSFREILDNIIKSLPEIYAGVIRLRFFYGLEINEISDRLNISEDNVYQRIARARKLIKNSMGDDWNEQKNYR